MRGDDKHYLEGDKLPDRIRSTGDRGEEGAELELYGEVGGWVGGGAGEGAVSQAQLELLRRCGGAGGVSGSLTGGPGEVQIRGGQRDGGGRVDGAGDGGRHLDR